MERNEWLTRLELLHARRRDGAALQPAEEEWYLDARGRLLRAAVELQRLRLPSAAEPRRWVRVLRGAPVRLSAPRWKRDAVLADLGRGGFAAWVEELPRGRKRLDAALSLSDGPPVPAQVRVVAAGRGPGLRRASFAFESPSEALGNRVEEFLLDGLLETLVFWDDVLERLRL
jgi:hypothetical protein